MRSTAHVGRSNMKTNAKNIANNKESKTGNKNEQAKKPFDKKKYRLQKYSNKYRINKWEVQRKKAMLRALQKEMKNDPGQKSIDLSIISENANNITNKPKKKSYAFEKIKRELKQKQEEKVRRREEANQKKAEREEALKKYREKKKNNFKVLSKKTRKGQPVMKGRLQLLAEKIQNLTR